MKEEKEEDRVIIAERFSDFIVKLKEDLDDNDHAGYCEYVLFQMLGGHTLTVLGDTIYKDCIQEQISGSDSKMIVYFSMKQSESE